MRAEVMRLKDSYGVWKVQGPRVCFMAMTCARPHPQVGEFALHMGDLLEGGVDRVDAKVELHVLSRLENTQRLAVKVLRSDVLIRMIAKFDRRPLLVCNHGHAMPALANASGETVGIHTKRAPGTVVLVVATPFIEVKRLVEARFDEVHRQ